MRTFVLWTIVIGLLLSPAAGVAGDVSLDFVETTHSQTKLVVLGDSLSAGYGIELKASWPSLLQKQLIKAGYPVQVVNASISGETTKGGLSRVTKLLSKHQPKLVLIELGANDGLRGVPAKHAQKNLQRIIEKVTDAGAAILVFEMKVPPNYGQNFAMQYDDLYAEIGRMDHVDLVPFFLEDVIFEPQMMQADGLHPTALAQPLLLEHVWPYVEEKIREINPIINQQPSQNCQRQDDSTGVILCDKHGELNEILQ